MPSPPRKNESQQDFISRCIAYLKKHEDKTNKQAAGQCYGIWRQRHKKAHKAKKAHR